MEHNGRFLLGDEMGVGKTIQAIGLAYIYREDWPLLIITPSALKFCWKEEICKWLPDINPEQIQVFTSSRDEFLPYASIFIMSYEISSKLTD